MLVDGFDLFPEKFLVVDGGKQVKLFFDGQAHAGAGALVLAPVEDQFFGAQGVDEVFGDFFDLLALLAI